MLIEHVAIWTDDLERLRKFYTTYFGCRPGELYRNPTTEFESTFLTFDGGARLELMRMPSIPDNQNDPLIQYKGLIHFAISAANREEVVGVTERLRRDGHAVAGEPRTTGDGYFESCVLDPDGNRVEIVAPEHTEG